MRCRTRHLTTTAHDDGTIGALTAAQMRRAERESAAARAVNAVNDRLAREEQRRPTREDRRHRVFLADGRAVWVSVPA